MAYTTVNCPSCNGEVKLNDSLEKGFCLYCGSPLVIQSAKPSGGATDESLVKRGYMEIENGRTGAFDLGNAISLFDEALKINPDNYQAWLGKFDAYLLYHNKTHLDYKTGNEFKVGIFAFQVNRGFYRITIHGADIPVSALESAIKVAPSNKKPELIKLQEQYVTIPMQKIQRINDLVDKKLCVFCESELKKRILSDGYGKCKNCGIHSDYIVFAYCDKHFR